MSNKKYKVTLIEPSEIVTAGLSKIIDRSKDFYVAKVFHGLQNYSEVQNGNADIIIVNPSVVNSNGYSDPKSLIPAGENTSFIAINYGPFDDETFRNYDGSINIFCTQEQIIRRLTSAVKTTVEKETSDNNNELSAREREILTSVAKGLTNKEIADEHNISVHTVISHRKNISHKLGINSISGLTIYAVMNKLVDMQDF